MSETNKFNQMAYFYYLIRGTTIIVVILNQNIYVAADSKIHNISGEPLEPMCKIRQVGNVVVAVAGLEGDPETGWNTLDIAQKALEGDGFLEDRVNLFIEKISGVVIPLLREMREKDEELYNTEFLGKPIIQVVFVSADGSGKIKAIILEPINVGTEVDLKVHESATSSSAHGAWFALGHFNHLSPIVDADPNFWNEDKIKDQLRSLIAIEEQNAPNTVGGEIRIVKIEREKIIWLE